MPHSPVPESILRSHLDRIREAKILVVGDVILDRYDLGTVERLSPEAPVPVLRLLTTHDRLGGAANAAANLATLGATPELHGVTGNDEAGRTIRRLLKRRGIRFALRTGGDRPTTLKVRAVADGQQLLRIDTETADPIAARTETRLIRGIRARLGWANGVLVSDYGKGAVTDRLLQFLRLTTRRRRLPFVIDGKSRAVRRYRGASLLTPSHHDAKVMTGVVITDMRSAKRAATSLARATGSVILLTLGPAGMLLRLQNGQTLAFRSTTREVYDATGAGDTVAATVVAALAVGTPLPAAVELASRAAGVAVGKLGTATVTRRELLNVL